MNIKMLAPTAGTHIAAVVALETVDEVGGVHTRQVGVLSVRLLYSNSATNGWSVMSI